MLATVRNNLGTISHYLPGFICVFYSTPRPEPIYNSLGHSLPPNFVFQPQLALDHPPRLLNSSVLNAGGMRICPIGKLLSPAVQLFLLLP